MRVFQSFFLDKLSKFPLKFQFVIISSFFLVIILSYLNWVLEFSFDNYLGSFGFISSYRMERFLYLVTDFELQLTKVVVLEWLNREFAK